MSGERGATAVFTAVTLIILTGFAALAVDVGALWWDKKELQNGADAAALALAQKCADADGAPGCEDDRDLALRLASENKDDRNATIPEGVGIQRFADTVTVTVTSDRALWFGRLFEEGSAETAVGATASATWGGIGGGWVLPLTVSECYLWAKDAGKEVTIPLHDPSGKSVPKDCIGGSTARVPGGFSWLDPDPASVCSAYTRLYNGDAGTVAIGYSNPGNKKYPDGCLERLRNLAHQTVLVPVFDHSDGAGESGEYWIKGYAKLQLSAFCIDNSSPGIQWNTNTGNNKCTGQGWLKGTFIEMVELGAEIGAGEDYGARTVRLTIPS